MGGNSMTAGRKVNTQSQSWCTPPKYVNAIKSFFGGKIDLDPCSNAFSIVHAETEFKLPETDGLKQPWNYPTIYINPPYGADRKRGTTIKDWLAKCALSHNTYNAEIIALIPVASNTSHWKKFIFGQASSICFLYDTRLRFLVDGEDTGKGAPMACCLVYWGDNNQRFFHYFIEYGAVVDITRLKGEKIGTEHREFCQTLFEPNEAYVPIKNTIYEQLENKLNYPIESAPIEWNRTFNIDFFITVREYYIGLQIKPESTKSSINQYQWIEQNRNNHHRFTEKYKGKVFFVFSKKNSAGKKQIDNIEVIEEIKAEIERLKHL